MAYIGNGPGVASQRIVSTLTATDGQTSFTPTSGYTVGYVDVYLNGVKLISGTDFTASNGTNVVLTSGAATGDTLEVVAYLPRGLSDGYTKAEADALIAAIDLTAFNSPVQLKNYTTTQRNALTGLESGDTIYNSTTGSLEFYDGANWIATNLIPTVNSVTGTIYGGAASTLTVSITNATDSVTVRFSEGGAIVADVDNVTVTSGSATVSVPAAVYGQTAGDTISVSILNQDGTPSSNAISKAVVGLPTGGTITTYGSYRVHTFTSSGSITFYSGFTPNIEYLAVAGGGGAGGGSSTGGYTGGGGGGAGGLSSGTSSTNTESYTVTIGAGGAGGAISGSGTTGQNTVFGSVTVLGGGGGGSGGPETSSNRIGKNGGSGGGSGYRSTTGGSGTSGQGFAGGHAGPVEQGSGGGGGAGGAGQDGVNSPNEYIGGDGGVGVQNSLRTGSAVYYAGGGGAGGLSVSSLNGFPGSGGLGGGGDGKYLSSQAGVSGTTSTGGGGGGGGRADTPAVGGNGGSGIVIVRYQLS
jgi:hypothetical protein